MGFISFIKGRLAIALQVGKSHKSDKLAKVVRCDEAGNVTVRDYVPQEDKEDRSPVLVEKGVLYAH